MLVQLRLTAAASVSDAGICIKILGPGKTSLVISNKEMQGFKKLVKSLKDCSVSIKGVTKTAENKKKTGVDFSWYVVRYLRCKLIGKFLIRQASD